MFSSGPTGRGEESPSGGRNSGGPLFRGSGHDQRLNRNQRITRSALFRETYAQGNRWFGKYMVLWLRQAEDASLKLGVVSSRKVGKAVERVRARRLLREVYRRNRWRFHGDCDVILVSRRAILGASWDDLVEELLSLAAKAGILNPDDNNA